MFRHRIFLETKQFIKGKWFNLASILMLIWIVNFALGIVMKHSVFVQMLLIAFETADIESSAEWIIRLEAFNTGGLLAVLITGFVSNLLNGGFMMSLLKSVQENRKMKLKDVIKTAFEYAIPIAIVSLTIAIINSFLSFVPSVTMLLQMVVSYMLIFSEFIMVDDKTQDAVIAMKKSVKMTRGHKLMLFNIELMYLLRPYAGLLLTYLGIFVAGSIPVLGMILVVSGLVLFLALYFWYIPYAKSTTALYYQIVKTIQTQE